MNEAIVTEYCDQTPSPQTALDIFRGYWKSALPKEANLVTGKHSIFAEDPRVIWARKHFPSGYKGMEILELGPFEGYDSILFEKFGALTVWAIEGNNINFLKCLVLKDVLGLKVRFLHGDIRMYLRNINRNFDLIWASGVLYHSDNPLELLELISTHTDNSFIWTHYYTPTLTKTRGLQFPENEVLISTKLGGRYVLRKHLYFPQGYPDGLPLTWEGGVRSYSYWLERDSLFSFIKAVGFDRVDVHEEGELDGMPYIGFLARRSVPRYGRI